MVAPPHPPGNLEPFAALLRAGEVVAFPTETVYGLGADATNSDAVLKIYETKGRPRFNPLISHVPDAKTALSLAHFSDDAKLLAGVFWPGPLTLVLPKSDGCPVSELATAGLNSSPNSCASGSTSMITSRSGHAPK